MLIIAVHNVRKNNVLDLVCSRFDLLNESVIATMLGFTIYLYFILARWQKQDTLVINTFVFLFFFLRSWC